MTERIVNLIGKFFEFLAALWFGGRAAARAAWGHAKDANGVCGECGWAWDDHLQDDIEAHEGDD